MELKDDHRLEALRDIEVRILRYTNGKDVALLKKEPFDRSDWVPINRTAFELLKHLKPGVFAGAVPLLEFVRSEIADLRYGHDCPKIARLYQLEIDVLRYMNLKETHRRQLITWKRQKSGPMPVLDTSTWKTVVQEAEQIIPHLLRGLSGVSNSETLLGFIRHELYHLRFVHDC